jgi:hypothetical protein
MPRRVLLYPGLVRTMRQVRLALQQSLPSAERAKWARQVERVLEDVSAAAGEAGLTPAALRPASRQAYDYLASLDFAAQGPSSSADRGAVYRPVRVTNLIRGRDRMLERLFALAQRPQAKATDAVRERMADTVGEVGILCERAGTTPAALPDPSRRAYRWMSFLSEPGRLETHLLAQAEAVATDPRVRVDLFHLAGLYRFAWKGGSAVFTLSEAFLDAPRVVLRAAVKLAIPYTRKRLHRGKVRAYAAGPEFERRLMELETSGGSLLETPRGLVHDLEAVFADVNRAHFDSRMGRPRLSWLATTSLREFGHYISATDLVLVSCQLDAPDVPRFVVEHVMHHELLHRELGAVGEGGRRVYHTAAFRQAERGFPHYAEADAFLEGMARRRRV